MLILLIEISLFTFSTYSGLDLSDDNRFGGE